METLLRHRQLDDTTYVAQRRTLDVYITTFPGTTSFSKWSFAGFSAILQKECWRFVSFGLNEVRSLNNTCTSVKKKTANTSFAYSWHARWKSEQQCHLTIDFHLPKWLKYLTPAKQVHLFFNLTSAARDKLPNWKILTSTHKKTWCFSIPKNIFYKRVVLNWKRTSS